jgi:hypothetical protein
VGLKEVSEIENAGQVKATLQVRRGSRDDVIQITITCDSEYTRVDPEAFE